jgi:hypothetical protein
MNALFAAALSRIAVSDSAAAADGFAAADLHIGL